MFSHNKDKDHTSTAGSTTHNSTGTEHKSLMSNLTSRFGMNDNVAEPQDAGHTVVGGGFPQRHTADNYVPSTVPGQGRDLEGRGTTGEVFGHRTEGMDAGVTQHGATGVGSGAGLAAGTRLGEGAKSDGQERHHQQSQPRHGGVATSNLTRGEGVTGVSTAVPGVHGGATGHQQPSTGITHGSGRSEGHGLTTGHADTSSGRGQIHRDHNIQETSSTLPLSGQHHANAHGIPGTKHNALGSDAAPQATAHGHQGGLASSGVNTGGNHSHRQGQGQGQGGFRDANNLGPDQKDLESDAGPRFGL